LLDASDRIAARFMFERLLRQYQRHDERGSYCASHPDDEEADQIARRSSARFVELRDELITWAGADPGEFMDLLGEVLERTCRPYIPIPAPPVVLLFGSRHWTDKEAIRSAIAHYPQGTVFLHGDNGYDADGNPLWGQPDELAVRGADKLAGAVARSLGYEVRPFTPEWKKFGRSAGPRRNTRMLEEGQPTECVGFHPSPAPDGGTGDMKHQAEKAGKPVRMIGADGSPPCRTTAGRGEERGGR
jgi:hypothetical protein